MENLTKEQLESVKERLSAFTCQVCGSKTWKPIDLLVELRPFTAGPPVTEQSMPLVSVSCTGCGQIILMSAFEYLVTGGNSI